jgi:thiol-disulfide isomerase/thioredoxin
MSRFSSLVALDFLLLARGPDPLSVTLETFDQALSSHGYLFVMFTADWCKYCKEAMPGFVAASRAYPAECRLRFSTLEYTNAVRDRFGVSAIPKFLLFGPEGLQVPYPLGRSEGEYLSFVKSQVDCTYTQSAGLAAGTVVAVVLGSLALLVVLCFLWVRCRRRRGLKVPSALITGYVPRPSATGRYVLQHLRRLPSHIRARALRAREPPPRGRV